PIDTATPDDNAGTTPVSDLAPATFKKLVEVELNDHDIAQKARQASLHSLQIEELEAEKKRISDDYKNRIGALEAERDLLLSQIRRGRDELELEVYERRDYDRHVVEIIRADSFDVVDSRAMKPRELQQPLPSL